MNAINHAVLAVIAANKGDRMAAQEHIERAERKARLSARRRRQVVEIAGLVVAGNGERAAGLALEHTAEFPDDADVLAQLAGETR